MDLLRGGEIPAEGAKLADRGRGLAARANRFNEIVVFARLDYMTQRTICEDLITAESARLAGLGHRVTGAPVAVEFLVRAGYRRMLGARPMREAVERHLQQAIAADLLAGGRGSGLLVSAEGQDGLVVKGINVR